MFSFTEEEILAAFPKKPWPHQLRGVVDLFKGMQNYDTICYGALTGSGKTLVQAAILNLLHSKGMSAIIYNARRPLVSQLSRTLDDAGIHHGARAASMKFQQNLHANMQIASLQTDFARVLDQACWDIHQCDLMMIDECHQPEAKAGRAQQLIQRYLAAGTKVVGFTGTPLEISHIYKELIVAGTKREMLDCKAHILAKTYAIHQMDVSKIRPTKTGEYNEGDLRRDCWSPAIVGYAYEDWKRLNPDARPTMASAPGVAESVWVAQQWFEKGHKVAHIDAGECWVDGERYSNDNNGVVREQILEEARKGKFELITNCEVLTAGIDIPCLAHVILLRPFGKLSSFLQVVGRGIRWSPETPDYLIVQDHVGATYAHGSVNEERDWQKMFDQSETEIREEREKTMQQNGEKEPITCTNCGRMRQEGARCPQCGHISDKRVRQIVQLDGTLEEVEGRIYTPKEVKPAVPTEQKILDSIFYPSRNSKSPNARNFNQIIAEYKRQTGTEPPPWLKRLPRDKSDYCRKARDLSWEELT